MLTQSTDFLDKHGLETYDALIKKMIPTKTATASSDGLMSAADKKTLDDIADAALGRYVSGTTLVFSNGAEVNTNNNELLL